MWDDATNTHLFTNTNIRKAEKLIEYTMTFGLYMSLGKGKPTIEHFRSKRTSCPDNVFVSASLEENIVRCEVHPEERPNKTDHFPIKTEIIMDKRIGEEKERRDWRKVVWGNFRDELEKKMENPPKRPISTKSEAQKILDKMMKAINKTVESHIPIVKTSKFQRRWWNEEIDELIRNKRVKQRLANRVRHIPGHSVHAEVKKLRNETAALLDEDIRNSIGIRCFVRR